MSLKGGNDRYGAVARSIHWMSALALVALLTLGVLAAGTDMPALKIAYLQVHIPLGAFTLALTLFRIVWLLIDHRPPAPMDLPKWQIRARRWTHVALYLLTILTASSGISLMIMSGAAEILFAGSSRALPDFRLYAPMTAHAVGAFTLLGLIGLHVLAALYHQYVRRDHLLYRMGIGASANAVHDSRSIRTEAGSTTRTTPSVRAL
jgi:cytochrome b561